MTDAQQREAARQFFYKWNGKGKEDEDARDVRALYPDVSLFDLYDPFIMSPELCKPHHVIDRAVMFAYGMPIKKPDEESCVAWLMRLY